MKYKGDFSSLASYSVGDIVIFTDGVAYDLVKPAPVGTKCHDTLYWERTTPPVQDVAVLMHDFLKDMGDAIGDLVTGETAVSAMIAPEYTKKTYSKDNLVTHSGKLYKAKVNIGTAENWTASHWDETSVNAELAAANSELATANTALADVQGVVFNDKTLVLASSTESSTKKWAVTVDDSEGIEVNEVVGG